MSHTPGVARISVLGTLAEFHQEPIPFDMTALVELVAAINPELLCLDVAPDVWHQGKFDTLPPEYREALLPLAYQTDIVIVPIGDVKSPDPPQSQGWRGKIVNWLRNRLSAIQRRAPGPDAVNQGLRHELANLLYHFILLLSESGSFEQQRRHTDHLAKQTLEVALNNPGARILVVVNVQYCHVVRPRLKEQPEIDVVSYMQL